MKNFLSEKLISVPVAHRGLHSADRPENSLSAFEAALRAGYAIETDVQLTKDGFPVLFHDDTLLRMTGDPRKISDCSLNELRALGLKGSREKIPLLSEFLELVRGRVPILLELKASQFKTGDFLRAVAQAFGKYKGEYAVQSFQPLYLRAYRKLCPEIPCGLLTCSHLSLADFPPPFRRLKRHIVARMSLNFWVKPDFLSFEFHAPNRKDLRFGGPKFAWTVRSFSDETAARRLADNIIFEGFSPEIGRSKDD